MIYRLRVLLALAVFRLWLRRRWTWAFDVSRALMPSERDSLFSSGTEQALGNGLSNSVEHLASHQEEQHDQLQ